MPLPADRALGSIEPQAQLAWQHNDFDDVLLGGARVQQDSGSGWIARLGLPIKGDLATSAGPFQPYGRLNFYTRTSAAMPLFSSGRPHRPSSRARAATARAKSTRARPCADTRGEPVRRKIGTSWNIDGDAGVKSSLQDHWASRCVGSHALDARQVPGQRPSVRPFRAGEQSTTGVRMRPVVAGGRATDRASSSSTDIYSGWPAPAGGNVFHRERSGRQGSWPECCYLRRRSWSNIAIHGRRMWHLRQRQIDSTASSV
jgi:hypothetical protein